MKFLKVIGKFFGFIGVFLAVLLVTLYGTGLIFCYGPSVHARNLFITTILETGQMKFLAGMLCGVLKSKLHLKLTKSDM